MADCNFVKDIPADIKVRFIIDDVELEVQNERQGHDVQKSMYSNHKVYSSIKLLVVVNIAGMVVGISGGYGGATTDQETMVDSE